MQIAKIVILLTLTCSFTACGSLGPKRVEGNRFDYNTALQKSSDQQLLLNLVRLKYRDTPYFLEVSSVTSQLKYSASVAVDAEVPDRGFNIFGFGGNARVEENPTIVYSPLQGDKFITQFLSPVSLETLLLLYRSGWSIKRIFFTCLQQINGIYNAPNAASPTPASVPVYKEFQDVIRLFRYFQSNNMLRMDFKNNGKGFEIFLSIDPKAWKSEEYLQFTKILNIQPGQEQYLLTTNLMSTDPNVIKLETRSIMGVLFYLSQGVAVPESDLASGKVTNTLYPDGSPFDWNDVTGKVLIVKNKSYKPSDASTVVKYQGKWFYIDNTDLNSKSTFALLGQLFALQSGGAKGTSPLLTLSVGN